MNGVRRWRFTRNTLNQHTFSLTYTSRCRERINRTRIDRNKGKREESSEQEKTSAPRSLCLTPLLSRFRLFHSKFFPSSKVLLLRLLTHVQYKPPPLFGKNFTEQSHKYWSYIPWNSCTLQPSFLYEVNVQFFLYGRPSTTFTRSLLYSIDPFFLHHDHFSLSPTNKEKFRANFVHTLLY